MYKELQKVFVSGNLQQTGTLLTKLKVSICCPVVLLPYALYTAYVVDLFLDWPHRGGPSSTVR